MSGAPQCFVVMPFGIKAEVAGRPIDFNAVFRDLLLPAVRSAGLEAVRADTDLLGGLVGRSVVEHLAGSEYAVFDISVPNPNVYYELGVRHALRPATTILVAASGQPIPFDISMSRVIIYSLDPSGQPRDVKFPTVLADLLKRPRDSAPDSPVYLWLGPELNRAPIDPFSSEVARGRSELASSIPQRLAKARSISPKAIFAIEQELGDIADQEPSLVLDLFLSYRSVRAWDNMINLVPRMSDAVRNAPVVQQQLALALNNAGKSEEALSVLNELLRRQGPSSDTYGILGRVYEDQWRKSKDPAIRENLRVQTVEAYVKGFETDWRDPYLGARAVNLMEYGDSPDPRQSRMLPVVQYALERRLATGAREYWDIATRLELAVLARDEQLASDALSQTLAFSADPWAFQLTAHNLETIVGARMRKGEDVTWIRNIERPLLERAGALATA